MTAEEQKLIKDNAVKRLRALKDFDLRKRKPLDAATVKALRWGEMRDSDINSKLVHGPRLIKREIASSPQFSPNYAMFENRSTVMTVTEMPRSSRSVDAYEIDRTPGQEIDVGDEAPDFRARELVTSGQAELIRGAPVSHEPTDNGYVQYHLWFQPIAGGWIGRHKDGTVQASQFVLVEWFGWANLPGFPKLPCMLYLTPANFPPFVCCYEGEPAEISRPHGEVSRKWFRIPRQRNLDLEPEARKERERKKWIDEQIKKGGE